MNRGAWWATYSPWGLKESDMTWQLNNSCSREMREDQGITIDWKSLTTKCNLRPWIRSCNSKKTLVEKIVKPKYTLVSNTVLRLISSFS